MLDIILQILPVLGVILLVLLSIIIIILLLILFFPVIYKISGKKDAEAFSLSARANWLFGLLRVHYVYPEPRRLTVKLLWIMLYDSVEYEEKAADKEKVEDIEKSKGKTKEKNKEKTKGKAKVKAEEKTKGKIKDKTEVISKKQPEGYSDIVNQTTSGNMENEGSSEDNIGNIKKRKNKNNTDNTVNTEESQSADAFQKEQSQGASENHVGEDGQDANWVSEKIEKIKFTIFSTYDKIKKIWENITYYVSLLQEEETHLLFSHVMKRVGRILKNIRPRKLKANFLFGTGAPDTTGYVFGVYCMLSPVLGPGVIVTPDFERVVLEGDFDVTGTITSVVLFWHILKVIIDKKFRRFRNMFKTGRESVDTFESETKEKNTEIHSKKRKKRTRRKKEHL